MKCLLCLLVWCSLISYISSQCTPEDDGNLSDTTYIIPNEPDTTRGSFYYLEVPGLRSIEIINTDPFLTASGPVDETIIFSLTDEMDNYEEIIANGISPIPRWIRIQLTCETASSTLFFYLTIDDVNNNVPTFLQTEYRYSLPMPFPSNLEITQFGVDIIARDIDITNMGLTFAIEGNDMFEFTYVGTTDSLGKEHRATLVATRPLQFTETQTFTITATDWAEEPLTGSALLIIEVDEENSATSPPMFDEPYHEVPYYDTEDDHSASVRMGITNADLSTCQLEGDYARYFACNINGNEVNVDLVMNLEEEDIQQGGYRLLVVTALETENRFARTVIILQLPELITTTTACPTEPTETTTTCDVCEVCTTPTPEECICTTTAISTTECATETTVTLTTCEPCECTTTEAVTCPNIEDILSTACPTTTTEISPTLTTCEPCVYTTPEEVTCPEELECTCPPPTTETTLAATTCEPCQSTTETVTCPSVEDIISTACPSTTTAVTCDPCICTSTSTSVDPDDNTACSDCPDECTECPNECAECPDECAECPDECAECPDESTECPVCPNDCSDCTDEICGTPGQVDAVITFNGENFEFTLAAHEGTYSLPVSAKSTIDETITYTANNLPSQLNLDTGLGMLSNNDFLPSGLHEFTITATGDSSGAFARQEVTINVIPFEICADGARVSYSLLIKPIQENVEGILLTYPDEEDIAYTFTISEVSPSAGTDLFYVSEDGLTISHYALDREADHFENMVVTQYIVTVTITELSDEEVIARHYQNDVVHISNETYARSLASSREDSQQYILISDILNNPTRTIITIIVEDVNDNYPEFLTTSMTVGYPSSALLSTIAPPYIVQVEAKDDDIGDNAKLAYTVIDSRVRIHSSTGIIYPTDGMPDEDFTFTVTATDQNGEGLQSSNTLQVQVKILNQEHISVLTMENVFLEDIDNKILELNAIASVNIKQLEAFVLPSITTREVRAGEKYYLILTAYALDNSNALVTTEQLQEALANVQGLSVVTLSEANNDSSSSNVGLIAAVSILAVVLLLILIAFALFYYFRLRKSKPYDQMEEENAASAGPSTPPQYQKNIAMTRSSSKLSQLGHDIEKMERRPTGILITGSVGASDNDSPPVSPPKERRKSVVFNANVEQINIDTSRDSDDGIENSKL